LACATAHQKWQLLPVPTDSDLDVLEFSFGKDCLKRVSDNPIFFNDLFISSFIHSIHIVHFSPDFAKSGFTLHFGWQLQIVIASSIPDRFLCKLISGQTQFGKIT
jgi:hypothetical protein